jgi:acetyl esterase/lipase
VALDEFAEALVAGPGSLPASASDLADARAAMERDAPAVAGPPQPVAEVLDVDAAGVPARLYRPAPATGGAVLYAHGGGWALGSVAIDEDRVALLGDSAGGTLAASLALRLRDRREPPARLQALIYPCIDPTLDTPSAYEFADGYRLTRANMRWFWSAYLGGQPPTPEAAPALATDLSGLPPALVITASHDVLRDEGEAYGARLRAAGVATEIVRVEGTLHGFMRYAAWPAAQRTRALLGEALRAALA